MKLPAASFVDGSIHGICKCPAAVGVGIAGCVISMCSVVQGITVLRQSDTGCGGQKQAVAEGNVGRNRTAIGFLQLFGIGFFGNFFCRMGQKRAVAESEHGSQIDLNEFHLVEVSYSLRAAKLFVMLLTVGNRQGNHIFLSEFFYNKAKAGGGVHTAADKNEFLHI